jgi:small subunit ribosomal protein S1
MKQCKPNPWEEFAQNHHKGDKVHGAIKSITDFGIFIGLDGGIDGLVHLSDLDWNEPGETAVRKYQKGQELDAVVLAIDAARERISLGVKQVASDPLTDFIAKNTKGTIVKGLVKTVEQRGAVIDLGNGVEGYIKANDITRERIEDARTILKEGDTLEARFIGVDRKNRVIALSVREKEIQEEQETLAEYGRSAATGKTSLGDILKEQMGNN